MGIPLRPDPLAAENLPSLNGSRNAAVARYQTRVGRELALETGTLQVLCALCNHGKGNREQGCDGLAGSQKATTERRIRRATLSSKGASNAIQKGENLAPVKPLLSNSKNAGASSVMGSA
jgi:hypothetical protein